MRCIFCGVFISMGVVNNIWVKLFVLLLALLQPLIIVLCYGVDVHSISTMWLTTLQPLFIITNASTSYYLFDLKRWRIPSLFLLLLTAFSVEFSMITHNIFAIIFFITCVYSLYGIRRLRRYILIYILSLLVLVFTSSVFWAEVWAIIVICSYHLHSIYIAYCLHKKRRVN